MITLLTIVTVGFFLGMRHSTDPDHVLAVSTIVSREREVRRAALIGLAWGLGHMLTIFVVGSAMILFRIALPPRMGLAIELAVALMLIWLGVKNLGGLFSWSAKHIGGSPKKGGEEDVHYHAHGEYVHAHLLAHEHVHPHDPEGTPLAVLDRRFKRSEAYRWARPLVIGVVHGLAGSAAIALLVLSTISSVRWAVAYLAVFGIGTIFGMMLITISMGCTFAYSQKRFARIGHHFGWAAGLISVAFGLFIAYHIGFVEGLFTAPR
jgi:sulfite exporter TauE/SafE